MEELTYLFERLEKIDEKFDKKLDRILEQTTKTNGRVNALEERVNDHGEKIEEHANTITYSKGAVKIIWIVVGSIGTIGGMLVAYLINKI